MAAEFDVVETLGFDGTVIEIGRESVKVNEGKVNLTLWLANLTSEGLVGAASWNLAGANGIDAWTKDRVIFCFGIAAHQLAKLAAGFVGV